MHVIKYLFSLVFMLGIASFKAPETESKVKWIAFEKAIELHKGTPKKLLIDLYTDWCGWCKVMDRETYGNAIIAGYINETYYPVKFNAEQKESIIFNGHTFKFMPSGRRGVHELAVALTGNQLSYPTTVFMDEELRIIQPISGYLKPQQMETIINFIGENYYKHTAWEDFRQKHKSSL